MDCGLIDRQALKDAVKRYAGEPIKKKDRKCQAICLDMLGTIDAQHTIDAVEVRHGEWSHKSRIDKSWVTDEIFGFVVKCSNCGIETIGMSNYCPNCGARMDGERREG